MYTEVTELSILGVTAVDLDLSEADYSLLLSKICEYAAAIIDSYCGQSFNSETITENHDGEGLPRLFVNKTPILSMTKVAIITDSGEEDITADCTIYKTYIYYPGGFPSGIQNIQITYEYGFSSPPAAVTVTSFQLCKKLLYRFKSEKISQGMKSERLDDYQYTVDESKVLTEDMKRALSTHKKRGGIV